MKALTLGCKDEMLLCCKKKGEAVDGLKSGKCLGFPGAYCYIYPL